LCRRTDGLFAFAVATIKFLGLKHALPSEQYNIIADSPEDTSYEGRVEGVHGGSSLDSICISTLQGSFGNNTDEDDVVVRSVLAVVVLAAGYLPPSAIAALTHLEVEEVVRI